MTLISVFSILHKYPFLFCIFFDVYGALYNNLITGALLVQFKIHFWLSSYSQESDLNVIKAAVFWRVSCLNSLLQCMYMFVISRNFIKCCYMLNWWDGFSFINLWIHTHTRRDLNRLVILSIIALFWHGIALPYGITEERWWTSQHM